jgi:hypothetical protein
MAHSEAEKAAIALCERSTGARCMTVDHVETPTAKVSDFGHNDKGPIYRVNLYCEATVIASPFEVIVQ